MEKELQARGRLQVSPTDLNPKAHGHPVLLSTNPHLRPHGVPPGRPQQPSGQTCSFPLRSLEQHRREKEREGGVLDEPQGQGGAWSSTEEKPANLPNSYPSPLPTGPHLSLPILMMAPGSTPNSSFTMDPSRAPRTGHRASSLSQNPPARWPV